MHFTLLRRGHISARRSGNGREKNLKQKKSKDALAPWRALVPAADSHSYNKHIQSFKELTCPSEYRDREQKRAPVRPTLHTRTASAPRQTPRQGS